MNSDSPHTVEDVMTHTVVAVGLGASFKEIVRTMEQWQVSALPVLEGDGRVVGVVSEGDLLPKEEYREGGPGLFERQRRLEDLGKASAVTARELMTAPAVSVRAGTTLAQAARAMAQRRVKRLPVVDGEGRLTGVVSRSDLLKVFLRDDEEIAGEVRRQVVEPLFPNGSPTVRVGVTEGVVTFTGHFRDTALVPLAARMARSVEGVVDVAFELTGPPVPQHTGGSPAGRQPA
ncbi:CBS domain-containing protein [Streptomyces sp. JJ36]|uniref:CBS domain-containing protein n=1 Tax=Streptomyces sp. JJ36 TaxID=2736645 RepID=UPI001F23B349|nr:CBS domain-containing protein [Streptomyces sp. JJ36]MCF6524865.1 CBS domain-containing protein [Streptomyces sp. JJ36]